MTPAELALATMLAATCVNEAGWSSPADCALIWQVTESHARTPEARLAWLQRHSHTVANGSSSGNARWTSGLQWNDREPEGWPETAPPWSVYVERWRKVRRFAAALVTGRVTRRPCAERVWTWGSVDDAPAALRRGLRVVRCENTLNLGFALGRAGGES